MTAYGARSEKFGDRQARRDLTRKFARRKQPVTWRGKHRGVAFVCGYSDFVAVTQKARSESAFNLHIFAFIPSGDCAFSFTTVKLPRVARH